MDKFSHSEELINDDVLYVHQKVESKRIYNSGNKDERQHEFAKKRNVTLDSKQKLTSCEFEIASLFSELDQLIYPLVNRGNASQELAKQLILQKINNTGVLPILNEQCGVGKTSLVTNFRKVLENNQLELENISEKHPDVVKSLMKAVLVRIDMKIIYGANHNSDINILFDKNGHIFKSFILQLSLALEKELDTRGDDDSVLKTSYEVIKAILNPIAKVSSDTKKMANRICEDISGGMTMFLMGWTSMNLYPLLLFFDDLSALEEVSSEAINSFLKYGKCVFETRLSGIFMVVAGNSSTLHMSEGNNAIPIPLKHIVLDLMKEAHIIQLMKETRISDSLSMEEFLYMCNVGHNLGYFYKKVTEYTGGIPELIVYLVLSIVKYCRKTTSC